MKILDRAFRKIETLLDKLWWWIDDRRTADLGRREIAQMVDSIHYLSALIPEGKPFLVYGMRIGGYLALCCVRHDDKIALTKVCTLEVIDAEVCPSPAACAQWFKKNWGDK